MVAKI
jgi:hypothetical protein